MLLSQLLYACTCRLLFLYSLFGLNLSFVHSSRRSVSETYMPSNSMRMHAQTPLYTMTAAWLLPIVPTIVATASAGIVAEVLPNRQYAIWTITTIYILWGTGVPLVMVTLVIYFERLTLHKLPPRELIVFCFLPPRTLGQGGFAIVQLGKVSMQVLPKMGTLAPKAGQIFYVVSLLVALIMWGIGPYGSSLPSHRSASPSFPSIWDGGALLF